MAHAQSPSNDRSNWGLLLIPLLISSVLLLAGWAAARAGASYRATKVLLYPAIFFVSNCLAVMPFVCIGWVVALILGNREMANYVVGNASQLCLLSQAFGDPMTIPVWHVVLYQLAVWWFVARQLADPIASLIYYFGSPHSPR